MFWFWLTLTLFILLGCPQLYAAMRLYREGKRAVAGAVAGSLLLYAALTLAIWLLRLNVPDYTLCLGLITVWLTGYVGHGLDKFNTSDRFDRYLHAFGSFSFALITYCIIRSLVSEGGSKLFRAIFVWALGVFSGAAFEAFEFMHDRKKRPYAQHGLRDTNTDLVANLIGGFLAGVFAFFFLLTPA